MGEVCSALPGPRNQDPTLGRRDAIFKNDPTPGKGWVKHKQNSHGTFLPFASCFFFLFSTCFVPIIPWLFPRVLKTDAVKFSPNILVLCTRLSPGKIPLLFSLGVTGFSDLSLQSRVWSQHSLYSKMTQYTALFEEKNIVQWTSFLISQ